MKSAKIIAILCSILIVFAMQYAFAATITPYADSEFDSASTILKTTKRVTFTCATYETKSSISVTSCWLEKKGLLGAWGYVCSLTPPSTVSTNSFAYAASCDYSAYIGSGTYRVWATYNADGHTITRCSNERTF